MSKQRQKGTAYENHLLETYLRQVFPDVDRAPLKGINDYGDFINVDGWLLEAKKHDSWRLPDWIRTAQRKAAGSPLWAILFAADKRGGLGDLTVLPTSTFTSLLVELLAFRNAGRDDG